MEKITSENLNHNLNSTIDLSDLETTAPEDIDIEKLEFDDFIFYSNCIGGHSFFIEYKSKFLIKSTKPSEIKFYRFIQKSRFSIENFPKFYGIIEPSNKKYDLIKNYIKQFSIFIQKMLIKYQILSKDLEIGSDKNFNEKFDSFIKRQPEPLIKLNKSFEELTKKFDELYNNCKEHIFWIFYCFIEWESSFLIDPYIIISNFQHEIISPSIIDIKVGTEEKISKKTGKVKTFQGACAKYGCRIMGIYINNSYFKSRYDCRNLTVDEFSNELISFGINNKELKPKIFEELEKIKKFIEENINIKLDYASVLIILDNNKDNKGKKIIIGLINLNLKGKEDVEKIKKDNEKSTFLNKNIIKCIDNFSNLIKEL